MPNQDPEQKLARIMDSYDTRVVRHLNAEFERNTTRGDRFADAVASRVGSWGFIGIQSIILVAWMLWNLFAPESLRFDPAPFIGMNLLLSFQAGYTAPFIMMSANRSAKREHLEAEIDYAINYKAEDEIADMQHDLHKIHKQLDDLTRENKALHAKIDELLHRLGQA